MSVGIVHIGYGAFHRAHQAVYIDDYMNVTDDLRWGVAAVNLRASESTRFRVSQTVEDGYLLKTMSPAGEIRLRRVRPHVAFADWASEPAAAEAVIADPNVHIVTVTVTESGYALDDSGMLDLSHPAIAAEIAGGAPATIYGYLARALQRRADATDAPISILCCDNIRSNGQVLERGFRRYLDATGRDQLAVWLGGRATFPCSMVDRITPRATDRLQNEVADRGVAGFVDAVQSESFSQWVIEDRFAGPAPALDRVGVQIVDIVDPYEEAKIRILNGGHTALAYLAALAGWGTFDQAMRDPALAAHFYGWQREEVLPALPNDLPMNKQGYMEEVAARFRNAGIADQIERICMDGWSKMSLYIRPTLEGCVAKGVMPRYGLASIAGWYVFAKRCAANLGPFAYYEPYWDRLEPLLAPGAEMKFAREPTLWGELPLRWPDFTTALGAAIAEMEATWPTRS